MAEHVKHDYHLVDPSPWPFVGSLGAFIMALGAIMWMNHDYALFQELPFPPSWIFILGVAIVLYTMAGWWYDVVRESVVLHEHTPVVKLGLRYGMILFIASEVMFFVAWFWAYFDAALFPAYHGMTAWPPEGIQTFDPWHLPLYNTIILLTSGTTVTMAHHAIQTGDRSGAVQGLAITVLLGMTFTALQAYEYSHADFTFGLAGVDPASLKELTAPQFTALTNPMGDVSAIYGSTFFMATGFHGAHVIIGTIFLTVCLGRAIAGHFTPERHFGFEAAAWYWHFVDVVWLFLFAAIYVWGAGSVAGGHG
ncbi:MAG: cytochrome c oxidase subunit 3 [Alphaproteobacteria bacterium]|nr:cytochrome c oxidase subunit 3 [Alphaproteobacteria bacterium]